LVELAAVRLAAASTAACVDWAAAGPARAARPRKRAAGDTPKRRWRPPGAVVAPATPIQEVSGSCPLLWVSEVASGAVTRRGSRPRGARAWRAARWLMEERKR